MLTRDQFIESVRHETRVCRHLHGQLSEAQLGYRPHEFMRSTLELLRYLTYCAVGSAEALIQGSWDPYKQRMAAAETLEAADFPAAMDRQVRKLEELLAGIDDDDLREREVVVPPNHRQKLGAALINMSLKYLTAYRMQLFVYAKASGSARLDTWDNWAGQSRPRDED